MNLLEYFNFGHRILVQPNTIDGVTRWSLLVNVVNQPPNYTEVTLASNPTVTVQVLTSQLLALSVTSVGCLVAHPPGVNALTVPADIYESLCLFGEVQEPVSTQKQSSAEDDFEDAQLMPTKKNPDEDAAPIKKGNATKVLAKSYSDKLHDLTESLRSRIRPQFVLADDLVKRALSLDRLKEIASALTTDADCPTRERFIKEVDNLVRSLNRKAEQTKLCALNDQHALKLIQESLCIHEFDNDVCQICGYDNG